MSDYTYDARVVSVHDGDTVTLDVDLGFKVFARLPIRLIGINAPEMNTEAGKTSRSKLIELIPDGSRVSLVSEKDRADKYGGRWLGRIFPVSRGTKTYQSVNDWMVEKGLARAWDGKGKKPV
ncbi:MAG TPA: thermonuclease family protein [Bacteroidota bacterium]|nr:thermonuclease family protein [Bacteroidota bacterium]